MAETTTKNAVIKKDKKKYTFNLFSIITLVILCIYTICFLAPLFWGLNVSFMSNYQFSTVHDVIGFPKLEYWRWEIDLIKLGIDQNFFANYRVLFKYLDFQNRTSFIAGIFFPREVVHTSSTNFWGCIVNTLLYAGGGALVFSFCSMLVGYLVAKYNFKFSEILYSFVLITMIIPIGASTVANIELRRQLGIYDTWIGHYINMFGFESMYFLIFYAFFKDLSNTYNEAAEIDGASQFMAMFRICMPLAAKMFSTVILIQFVVYWNDYTTPMYYMPTKPTLGYALYNLMYVKTGGSLTSAPRKIAGMMVMSLPMLTLFILLKNKLMGNISIGGIKE